MTRACTCTDNPAVASVCICQGSAVAIQQLKSIRHALADVYTPDGIRVWLNAANKRLGGAAPLQLVMAGRGDEAVAEARWVAGGMHG